jgi:hypothetical protein
MRANRTDTNAKGRRHRPAAARKTKSQAHPRRLGGPSDSVLAARGATRREGPAPGEDTGCLT